MKTNRPYFYLVLFIGVLAVLLGFDYNKSGSLEWFDNIMQSAFITVFYIIFADKSYKKTSNKKISQP